jgi:hypothetical protein
MCSAWGELPEQPANFLKEAHLASLKHPVAEVVGVPEVVASRPEVVVAEEQARIVLIPVQEVWWRFLRLLSQGAQD